MVTNASAMIPQKHCAVERRNAAIWLGIVRHARCPQPRICSIKAFRGTSAITFRLLFPIFQRNEIINYGWDIHLLDRCLVGAAHLLDFTLPLGARQSGL